MNGGDTAMSEIDDKMIERMAAAHHIGDCAPPVVPWCNLPEYERHMKRKRMRAAVEAIGLMTPQAVRRWAKENDDERS